MKRKEFRAKMQQVRERLIKEVEIYGGSHIADGVCCCIGTIFKDHTLEIDRRRVITDHDLRIDECSITIVFADIFRPRSTVTGEVEISSSYWLGVRDIHNLDLRLTFIDMFEAYILVDKLYLDIR